jgi:hypothetical protein
MARPKASTKAPGENPAAASRIAPVEVPLIAVKPEAEGTPAIEVRVGTAVGARKAAFREASRAPQTGTDDPARKVVSKYYLPY